MPDSKIGARLIEEFSPLGRRVVVKRDKMLRGGKVLLPEEVEQDLRPATGVVVAVGHGVEELQVGDAVAYSMYGGRQMIRDAVRPLERQTEEWRVLRVEEIYGLWEQGGDLGEVEEASEDPASGGS